MKKLVALVVILGGFQAAQACLVREAQISGSITGIKKNLNEAGCLVRIKFTSFQPHVLCPLDIDDAINADIRTLRCDLKVGDDVAAYLTSDKSKLFLED